MYPPSETTQVGLLISVRDPRGVTGLKRILIALSLCSVGIAAAGSAHQARADTGAANAQANQDRPKIVMPVRGAGHHGGGGSNLFYHGATVGVETGADKVYLVFWGSQWTNNDPSGEASIEQNFFNHVGGSSWNNTVTQYCEGVASGTIFCNGAGTAATNPKGVLAGYWYDNGSAAPSSPSQSQLANEAIRAASHFGNTAAGSNNTVQYVINTATGNNASGFGTQYCAWHSSTSSSYGTIAYTNMPYVTDAGAGCGADFNGLGPNAGITIVGGHEFAETETDIFPNGGWLDRNGSEIGDKCAWISSGQGASANVNMNGATFPVQSLWSNAFNNGAGGCVLSF
jgi:serine protease